MNKLLLLLFLSGSLCTVAQSKDELEIRKILDTQTNAWNRGDLEQFMKGYWENDSLMFIGKSGITYGWKKTLENYRKGYPDVAAMGTLTFNLLSVNKLDKHYFFVVGKWSLARAAGNLSGHYTLLFRKIKGEWVIVADHSS